MANPGGSGLRGANVRRKFIMGGTLLVLITIVGFVLYTYAAISMSYSDGDRSGMLQKFSRKGWICKTWEGEVALVNLPGTTSEIFAFTVRDPAIAEQVEKTMGHRAVLHYEEHRGLPGSCFGETRHFVTAVRSVEQPGGLP